MSFFWHHPLSTKLAQHAVSCIEESKQFKLIIFKHLSFQCVMAHLINVCYNDRKISRTHLKVIKLEEGTPVTNSFIW